MMRVVNVANAEKPQLASVYTPDRNATPECSDHEIRSLYITGEQKGT